MAPKVLILSDGKPGHENQSLALCRLLELEYDLVRVSFRSRLCKTLSYVLDRFSVRGAGLFELSPLPGQHYRAVIGTGSGTFYAVKCLAQRLQCASVAILTPRGYRPDFTCMIVPEYDRPPPAGAVVRVPVNLCAADPEFFAERVADFQQRHKQQRPAVGFVIGGDNAVFRLDCRQLEADLRSIMKQLPDHEFWVTTSRRTPEDVEAMIDRLPFDYRLIFSRDTYNPIPAFMALCDRLVVTADSTSMISECVCYGSASVEVIMPECRRSMDNKFVRLIEGLRDAGAVNIYTGKLEQAAVKINLKTQLAEVDACI